VVAAAGAVAVDADDERMADIAEEGKWTLK
jgi:hypothetical protein